MSSGVCKVKGDPLKYFFLCLLLIVHFYSTEAWVSGYIGGSACSKYYAVKISEGIGENYSSKSRPSPEYFQKKQADLNNYMRRTLFILDAWTEEKKKANTLDFLPLNMALSATKYSRPVDKARVSELDLAPIYFETPYLVEFESCRGFDDESGLRLPSIVVAFSLKGLPKGQILNELQNDLCKRLSQGVPTASELPKLSELSQMATKLDVGQFSSAGILVRSDLATELQLQLENIFKIWQDEIIAIIIKQPSSRAAKTKNTEDLFRTNIKSFLIDLDFQRFGKGDRYTAQQISDIKDSIWQRQKARKLPEYTDFNYLRAVAFFREFEIKINAILNNFSISFKIHEGPYPQINDRYQDLLANSNYIGKWLSDHGFTRFEVYSRDEDHDKLSGSSHLAIAFEGWFGLLKKNGESPSFIRELAEFNLRSKSK